MDIFVVVMSPSRQLPAAIYGPFVNKHSAHVFIEDRLKQDAAIPESKKRAFVVRCYGTPNDPVFMVGE